MKWAPIAGYREEIYIEQDGKGRIKYYADSKCPQMN